MKFDALVRAIHKSISDATKSVEADGIRHLKNFFYPVDDNGKAVGDTVNAQGKQILLQDFKTGRRYRPKTVIMEYPVRREDKIETSTVEVPLVILSPIATPKVSQAKFVADLNISTDDNGDLQVDFANHKRGAFGLGDEINKGNTHIEITLEAGETPEGLQRIIDGYERALRAQIPG